MKKRRVFVLVLGISMLVLLAEGTARWILGLGDPPLTVRDPEIEYLFAANQNVRRFGRQIRYNQWSMRSEPFPEKKEQPSELRILVFGDSVINGGALTDQEELATTLLQRHLDRLDRPARVGNISAGSWGPENLLAYVQRYGWFEGDLCIFVLSTHDARDIRTFPEELGPDFPLQKPFALEELFVRYLAKYVFPRTGQREAPIVPDDAARERSKNALRSLLAGAQINGCRPIVLHHPEREEDLALANIDRAAIQDAVRSADVPFVPMAKKLGPPEVRALFYRDTIHVNEEGQKTYAEVLVCLAELGLEGDPTACVDSPDNDTAVR